MKKIGFAMCGSFCTHSIAVDMMKKLSEKYSIVPVMSSMTYTTDTRFGQAKDLIQQVEEISGKEILHTIVDTEPIGPKQMVDLMVVCPCTGNTLSKLANGITDTSVTMAVKSALRGGTPVVLCLATNDALGGSGQNLLRLMNAKNVYFVPLSQDDAQKKPLSLVADFSLLPETIEAAFEHKQLQPILKV
ncbi:dipicolinate synthase subunit B [Scatolibacter rhodanostii]|uniref:dipicolinate synthase subunit B n=1 Tax=Scatolibacter rhodanostii TaxID=2014781 RepID=UPI000C082137|nr:dipicolinate synthase subunit B [Scatolibacter rhodanostii]